MQQLSQLSEKIPANVAVVAGISLSALSACAVSVYIGYRWGVISGRKAVSAEMSSKVKDLEVSSFSSSRMGQPSRAESITAKSECSFYEGVGNEEGPSLKVIFLIRTDLQMSKGKVASQVGHAAIAMYKRMYKRSKETVKSWEEYGASKIALRLESETELFSIKESAQKRGVPVQIVVDSGKTGTESIKPGTRTVMVMGPAPQSILGEITGHLKLY
eukprot:TRINITY_DN8310_c0_g1_i2.p2 TRINITY_DN8310_c0_g1~~TRINITY_DN8310_c0_g1_i2.p2  ORF type:complete len:230 (+),score=34.41 TRINITY_DN8310_c0_g1_i2:45-692(+)